MIALGFGAGAAAWLLLLIVPLVVLYFLKLSRPRLQVPSLSLWRAVLEDRRVNSPFQRFKRSLLLLLQLMLLCLAVLAAMLPFWSGAAGAADRTVVLLDCSASMAARDADARPRLELARAAASSLIDSLQPDQELALIAFSQHARQLAPFTSNKRVLQQALAQLTVEDVPSDLREPLRMAEAMARTAPVRRVVLVSDGNFPAEVAFDLPYELEYRVLPPAGANLGITQLRARRRPGGGWSVFAGLQATDGVTPGAVLELHRNGELAGTEPVVLRSDRSQRLVFALADAEAGSLELRLRHQGFDALAADDTAFLELIPPRDLRVHVDPGLHAWRHAVTVSTGTTAAAAGTAPDLVIARDPAQAPAAPVALFDGAIPPGMETRIAVQQAEQGDAAVDWRRDVQLLEHVELGEVLFLDQPAWQPGAAEGDLERLGFEVLVHGRRGPLLAQRVTEEGSAYYLLAASERSTMPYRVAFPILVANLLRTAADRAGLLEVAGATAGILPSLRLSPGLACEVRGPDGSVRSEQTDAHGMLSDVAALHVGRYTVTAGGTTTTTSVSLLSPFETGLARTENISLSELRVTAGAHAADTDHPLWAPCALLATVVLLIEWVVLSPARPAPPRASHPQAARGPPTQRDDRLMRACRPLLVPGLLLAATAAAQDIQEVRWGFDGRAVPGRFNVVSVYVHNGSAQPFDGRITLQKCEPFGSRLDAPIEEPCHLSPDSGRWVQFYPFVTSTGDSWDVLCGRSSQQIRNTRAGLPALVLLESDVPGLALPDLPSFPAARFPPLGAATESLFGAVLDHVPAWDAARRTAFLDWLRAGGRLHLLRALGGELRFTGELAVLNDPATRFRIGAGVVVRHPHSRGQLDARQRREAGILPLSAPEQLPEPLQESLLEPLRELVEPHHNWGLIFLAAFVYLAVVGPLHWRLSRRWNDYRWSNLALLGVVAVFCWIFMTIGARGYGEQQQVTTLAYARDLGDDAWRVTMYNNTFVTSGDLYQITHDADHVLYSAAQQHEQVRGTIKNGKQGQFLVDIPLFSHRSFVCSGRFAHPGFHLALQMWDDTQHLGTFSARITGTFPDDPLEIYLLHQNMLRSAKREGDRLVGTGPTKNATSAFRLDERRNGHSLDPRMQRRDRAVMGWAGSQQLDAVARELFDPLLVERLGLLPEGPRPDLDDPDRIQVFVLAKVPAAFAVRSPGLERTDGYVVFHTDVFREQH